MLRISEGGLNTGVYTAKTPEEILEILKNDKNDIIEIETDVPEKFMKENGFFFRPRRVTYKLLIPNDLREAFSKSRKKAIKKSLKNKDLKITIEEPMSEETFCQWEKIYDKNISTKRIGIKRLTKERFLLFQPRSIGLFAWHNGLLAGGMLLSKKRFLFNEILTEKMSISLSSSTKELFKLGINSLLNYSALKLAKDRGYKYVDRGSDSNLYGHYLNPGLYIFKKSFGFRVAPKKKYGFAWTKIKNFSKLSDPIFFISMGKNGLEGNIFFKEILPNIEEYSSEYLSKINVFTIINNEAKQYKLIKPINLVKN